MKGKQLGIILMVIVILIAVFYLTSLIDTNNDNEEIQYIFEIDVDTNETNNYTMVVPIAKEKDGLMFEIDDYRTDEGNTSLQYIDTIHGGGLKIKANGSFSIRAKKNNTKLVGFTMANQSVNFTNKSKAGEDISYWYHLDNGIHTLDIEMHCWEIGEAFNYPRFDIEGELNNSNWVLIDGEYTMRVKN